MPTSSERTAVHRSLCEVPGGAVHVLRAGVGPTVLLLHDLPGSATAHEEDIRRLAEQYHVVAPDLPGCGLTAVAGWHEVPAGQGVEQLAELLSRVVQASGGGRPDLVGFGVGAILARGVAAAWGSPAGRIVTIGAPVTADLPELPTDLVPDLAGHHVLTAWATVRERHLVRMRVPAPDAATAHLPALPSPTRLHHEAAEVLTGSDWSTLCRIAEAVAVDEPVLTAVDVDEASTLLASGATSDGGATGPTVPAVLSGSLPLDGGGVGQVVATSRGHVFVRTAGHGPPLLLLHQSMESSASMVDLITELATDFTVYATDTPGCGFSDAPAPGADAAEIAAALGEVLDHLGLEQVRVCAIHSGCAFALELARQRPHAVSSLVLNGIPMFPPEDMDALARDYFWSTPHTPDRHGLHLMRLWSIGIDMSRFFPWFQPRPHVHRMKPLAELQTRFASMLRNVSTWHVPYRAALVYDPREGLVSLTCPAVIAAHATDPLAVFSEPAAALNPLIEARVLDPGVPATTAIAELVRRFDELRSTLRPSASS